jgi:hypothetical protein
MVGPAHSHTGSRAMMLCERHSPGCWFCGWGSRGGGLRGLGGMAVCYSRA